MTAHNPIPDPTALGARARAMSIASIVATAAIFGLTYGLAAPLIAANLAALGASDILIGANAAMHAVGVLLIATVLPKLAFRFGSRPLIVTALTASALILVAFAIVPFVWLWFPLRLMLGIAAETLMVLAQTWTSGMSTDANRGRSMALYMAALSLGFAGGPAILAVVGTGPIAYWIGAAICVVALLPILSRWSTPPAAIKYAPRNLFKVAQLAPIAVAATMLNAGVETAGLSFVALYAGTLGWSQQRAMWLVSTLMIGAIVLQLPIGWLADRVDRKRLVMVLAIAAAIGAFAWPWMLNAGSIAYALIFIWGGVFVGIYTVMLTIAGSRFSAGELVGVYAVMGIAWGIGALGGPTIVGAIMEGSPRYGLPFAIGAACAIFTAYTAHRRSEV